MVTASFTNTSQSTGEVLTWLWDFGDDETSSVENPVHTYNQAGTYQVTLRVQILIMIRIQSSAQLLWRMSSNEIHHSGYIINQLLRKDEYLM